LPPPEHCRLRGGVLSAQAGLPGLQGLFGFGLRYFEARPPPPGHSHLGFPFLMSQGGKVEKSGGFPSPQVQTETEPSAHSGAERLWIEVAKERRRRGARNILRNLY